METKQMFRIVLIFAILISTVGCDQVSKHIVRSNIDNHEKITIIRNHVTLMKVENKGAFMSWGHAMPDALRKVILTFFPVFFLTLLLVYVFIKRSLPVITLLGICLVVGGGIGNIYDRVIYGSVTDFLHIRFGIFQTGIFNIADMAIVAGILMVLCDYYLRRVYDLYFHKGNDEANA